LFSIPQRSGGICFSASNNLSDSLKPAETMTIDIHLSDEELKLLENQAELRTVSCEQPICTIVHSHLERCKPRPLVGFGLWKDRAEDGLAYQERIRAEWTTGPSIR
jgi:hypothetical protein